jgi:hypothetical protein
MPKVSVASNGEYLNANVMPTSSTTDIAKATVESWLAWPIRRSSAGTASPNTLPRPAETISTTALLETASAILPELS